MAMMLLKYFWLVVQLIIGYNLVLPIIFLLLASLKNKKEHLAGVKDETDYAIIVTAYEQVSHLPAVIASILKLKYQNFIVYIVADNCDITGLFFQDDRIRILRPEETLKSNVRSHFYAINHFIRSHERLTIIDSDNLIDPNYLNELNVYFKQGYEAIQGPRMPKNLNSTYACLDAARDIYYHFYDGKILFQLGSSATLAGSGMAFTTALYVQAMERHSNLSGAGFDKVLQAEIVSYDLRIAYAEKAIVYDEKTSRPEQLVDQRSRWIFTWFRYFKYGFKLLKNGIAVGSLNQILFGLVLLRPPLFMFLICAVLCTLTDIFINPFYALVWFAAEMLFILGFAVALLKSKTDRKIYHSLSNIPKFVYFQVAATIKFGVRKENIATKHTAS